MQNTKIRQRSFVCIYFSLVCVNKVWSLSICNPWFRLHGCHWMRSTRCQRLGIGRLTLTFSCSRRQQFQIYLNLINQTEWEYLFDLRRKIIPPYLAVQIKSIKLKSKAKLFVKVQMWKKISRRKVFRCWCSA